uniref:Uncharacterized protein n=1 Tax=Ixodes ricinus TaxID=34613 RepID=A0A6B0UTL4_IXORI
MRLSISARATRFRSRRAWKSCGGWCAGSRTRAFAITPTLRASKRRCCRTSIRRWNASRCSVTKWTLCALHGELRTAAGSAAQASTNLCTLSTCRGGWCPWSLPWRRRGMGKKARRMCRSRPAMLTWTLKPSRVTLASPGHR